MLWNSSRTPLLMSVGFMLIMAVAVGTLGFALAEERTETNATVDALLKERFALLSKIHDIQLNRYQVGRTITFEDVLEAKMALNEARLDLCKMKAERIETRREMVATAEKMLDLVKANVEAATATGVDALKAEARLVEMRIALEREKAAE